MKQTQLKIGKKHLKISKLKHFEIREQNHLDIKDQKRLKTL